MFSVEVKNMKKRFGSKTVLDGVTFLHNHGILGIAGSNGSGKSTLLKCLSGLLIPTSGSINWMNGDRTLSPSELKNALGYVAPYISLYHELTVRENVDFILCLRKQDLAEREIDRHLRHFQLYRIRNQPFGKLSTGQQQRARLACTLVYNPSILFLDEPGTNLDEEGRMAVREVVEQTRRQHTLVLLASNNPDELDMADRIFAVE